MQKNIKVSVQPVLDSSFVKKIQTTLNKKPIKIKVQLDRNSLESMMNKLPLVKLKIDETQMMEDMNTILNRVSTTVHSSLGNITINNTTGQNADLSGLSNSYQSLNSQTEAFGQALSNLETQLQRLSNADIFSNIQNDIAKANDSVQTLNTSLNNSSSNQNSNGLG